MTSPTDTFRLRGDLSWREVDCEVIVLDRRTWGYLSINGSGALLWPQLLEGASASQLVDLLLERYDLARERAAADVDAFVAGLRERDLLQQPAA